MIVFVIRRQIQNVSTVITLNTRKTDSIWFRKTGNFMIRNQNVYIIVVLIHKKKNIIKIKNNDHRHGVINCVQKTTSLVIDLGYSFDHFCWFVNKLQTISTKITLCAWKVAFTTFDLVTCRFECGKKDDKFVAIKLTRGTR